MIQLKSTIAAALILCPTTLPAQEATLGMDHASHGSTNSMTEYMATMDMMMTSMGVMPPSGDVDSDFLLMMIPHHQSAIDMANVELANGDDAETRAMAQRVIDAQQQEIAEMKAMLARLGVALPTD